MQNEYFFVPLQTFYGEIMTIMPMRHRLIIFAGLMTGLLAGVIPAVGQNATIQTGINNVSAGVGNLVGAIQRQQMMNASAMLLYGQEGCEADGYVVAQGIDGYFSVWDGNAKCWQIMEPSSSTILQIILFDARACVIHRWLRGKWCIVDMLGHPEKKHYYRNQVVVDYKYDDMKCVARNAPIAVGKGKGKKMRWGLVTRNPESGAWNHSVEDNWESMDIYRFEDIFYARALRKGYATLYALDGSIIAEGAYEDLNIFDGNIEGKNNGQWTKIAPFEIVANYRRIEPVVEEEPKVDPLVPTR